MFVAWAPWREVWSRPDVKESCPIFTKIRMSKKISAANACLTKNENEAEVLSVAIFLFLSFLTAYKTTSFGEWLATIPTTFTTVYPLSRAFMAVKIRMRSSSKFRIHHITGVVQLTYAAVGWYKLVWDPSFLSSEDHREGWVSLLVHWLARLCAILNLGTSIPLLAYMPRNIGAQLRRAFVYGILLMIANLLMQYSFLTAQSAISMTASTHGAKKLWVISCHVITNFFGILFSLLGGLLALFSIKTLYQKPEHGRNKKKITRRTWQMLFDSFFDTDNENEANRNVAAIGMIAIGIPGCLMCLIMWNLLLNPGCVDVGVHNTKVHLYNDMALDFLNVAVFPTMMFDLTLLALGRVSANKLVTHFVTAQLASFIGPPLILYMSSPEVFQGYTQMLVNTIAIS